MNHFLRVCQPLSQLGDWDARLQYILTSAQQAHDDGAQALLLPAQALPGGAGAGDYVLRAAYQQASAAALAQLVQASGQWPQLTIVLGHDQVAPGSARCLNGASVIRNGTVLAQTAQQTGVEAALLYSRQYQNLHQHATAGQGADAIAPCVVALASGLHVGVLLEQDVLHPACTQAARAAGAQVLLVLQAQPFEAAHYAQWPQQLGACARAVGLPIVTANGVGGQDAWVFAGCSMAVDAQGQLAVRAPSFVPAQVDVPLQLGAPSAGAVLLPGPQAPQLEPLPALWHALVLAVRDYVEKNRFPGALLGLSGGIDSALVLAIAVDALGAQRVRTVMMPSPYTADMSWQDAQDMAQRLGVQHDVIAIAPQVQAFEQALAPLFAGRAPDTTEENLQARCRGVLLMALSNKLGHVVLTTSNKSEIAMGYSTLYGDMAGGFAVLCDVYKTEVFALARWRNANDPFGTGSNPIPERIITRPPSAELRPGQKDEDSLPPYPVLDAALRRYLEQGASTAQLEAAGFDAALVQRVQRALRINAYKRAQAPVGPRLSNTAFGQDFQTPMTHVLAL